MGIQSARKGVVQVSSGTVDMVTLFDEAIRDTNDHYAPVPHVMGEDNTTLGVWEQSLIVVSNLDATVSTWMRTWYEYDGSSWGWGPTVVDSGLLSFPDGSANEVRYVFVPEVGTLGATVANLKTIELVDLRMPHPGFTWRFKASTTPTSGSLKVMAVRRY